MLKIIGIEVSLVKKSLFRNYFMKREFVAKYIILLLELWLHSYIVTKCQSTFGQIMSRNMFSQTLFDFTKKRQSAYLVRMVTENYD